MSGSRGSTAVTNSPHLLVREPCDYTIVIPTKGRWREAHIINPRERSLKGVTTPYILVKTLQLLETQGIAAEKVNLFVNGQEEADAYRKALSGSEKWRDVSIIIGVDGILEQRNFIVKYYPEGTNIVSLDDDVEQVFVKNTINSMSLEVLPPGGLEAIIFDAYHRMRRYPKAHIWGLHSTVQKNVRNMKVDGISTRNGEINGFFYGFRNRHDDALLPRFSNATEDAERSVRYFAKDGIVLRYRMYCCETRCFENCGGLQHTFGQKSVTDPITESNERRKAAEAVSARKMHEAFPDLVAEPKDKMEVKTLTVHFKMKGGSVIPSTTAEKLQEHSFGERPPKRDPSLGDTTQKKRAAAKTPSPPIKRARKKRVPATTATHASSSDEEPDVVFLEDEAADEDDQLFRALAHLGPANGMPEEERLYQAWVRSYNGDHEDPYQVAVVMSEALQKKNAEKEEEEKELLKKAMDESTRLLNLRIKENLHQLVEMGFCKADAESALLECDGNVDNAMERLLSAA